MTNQDQSLLLGLVARKATSPHGLDAEECQEVGGDAGADDLLGPFGSRQRRGHRVEGGHVRETLAVSPPLVDIPERRSPFTPVLRWIFRPQHRQPLRALIREGPEQHGIQDAEHRGVGANRQRQRGCRGRRKSRTLAEAAKCIAHVARHILYPQNAQACHEGSSEIFSQLL
jgi:hypothetical protein